MLPILPTCQLHVSYQDQLDPRYHATIFNETTIILSYTRNGASVTNNCVGDIHSLDSKEGSRTCTVWYDVYIILHFAQWRVSLRSTSVHARTHQIKLDRMEQNE
jgi:hypothetical protein